MKKFIAAAALLLSLVSCSSPQELHIVTTGDVHGAFFDNPYTGGSPKPSLMAVKCYVDSLRDACGAGNVLLIDVGDCLQGDNAAYFYNYVSTSGRHVFPKMAKAMGYDVCVLGNHDIETGHAVYDKVRKEMKASGIDWLAGNAVRTDDGKPYFPLCSIVRKAGRKIAVLGYDNANIRSWLSPELWSGMEFISLTDCVASDVEAVRSKYHPDLVLVAAHTGSGKGDGSSLENQGFDVFNSVPGIDVMVCAHDHRPLAVDRDGRSLVNGGSKAKYVGHVTVSPEGNIHAETVRLDPGRVDAGMKHDFMDEYEAVREFTMRKVGSLAMPLATRDAYRGMSDYINLIHTVQLKSSGARISIAAPLTFDGKVNQGEVIFNDMFTIYPFENQLFVLKLSGAEILGFLEYSYAMWIRNPAEGGHVLNIRQEADARTETQRWSFVGRSYNFDSAAGINYTVDITKPEGERVSVTSMSDGTPFCADSTYTVAMTSYRANGGGGSILKGAGLEYEEIDSRIVSRLPEIRNLIYDFFMENNEVTSELAGDPALLGVWKFVPESLCAEMMEKDMELLFR